MSPRSNRPRPSFNDADKEPLYIQQKRRCNACKVKFRIGNLTVDHKKPRSKGGSDKPGNLQLLCGQCNSIKGTGTQAQLLERLVEKGIISPPSKAKPKAAQPKPKGKEKPKRGKGKDPVDAYLDEIDKLFGGL